jgi:hypothetical protein
MSLVLLIRTNRIKNGKKETTTIRVWVCHLRLPICWCPATTILVRLTTPFLFCLVSAFSQVLRCICMGWVVGFTYDCIAFTLEKYPCGCGLLYDNVQVTFNSNT